MKIVLTLFLFYFTTIPYNYAQTLTRGISRKAMQTIYEQVRTPFKYGLVLVPDHLSGMMDSPTIFREGGKWYMTFIQYDGRGYETWLAESQDLLGWKIKGKLLSLSQEGKWDDQQKAGYNALQDPEWEGTYALSRFRGRYWMSYLGGPARGYEAGDLAIGMAYTTTSPSVVHEWKRLPEPVLSSKDSLAGWWENNKIYKSMVMEDRKRMTGHRFVMYYNASGDSVAGGNNSVERIGMATSDDMAHWHRLNKDPVLYHSRGITGDALIRKIGRYWVMFYFGAFWEGTRGAFNRFAVSKDLIHWTDWEGANLVEPSEPFDSMYAHKSCVLKFKGTVYHFYCAVNNSGQRGIAVATSVDKGKSDLRFPDPGAGEKKEVE